MSFNGEIMLEFCRLCQSRLGRAPLRYDEDLIKKIAEVTKVEVNDELNNYLPTQVCLSCKDKIQDTYDYIQIVQKTDRNLRDMVRKKYFSTTDTKGKTNGDIERFHDAFKCEKCLASFLDQNLLKSHVDSHADQPNNYKCPLCSKTFTRECSYNSHKKCHIENTNNASNEDVENKASLRKCQRTKPKFKIKSELQEFATFPQEGDTFQCNTCDKKFSDKNNLRTHLKIHRNFVCTEKNCSKELPSAYSLKIHRLDHLGKRPFLCVTCGKSFRTKSSLSCHEKIHSDVKGYKCDLCNIGFSVRSNLRAHEKKYHEGIRFYCSQCTKEFMSKCSLERHEKIHSGIKEFKCEQCEAAFYTKKELMKHQRYHQGLKQYKCEECFKTFFERHHLIIHLRSHSGERPYVCKIPGCGKAFAESQKLKRHHTAKHNAMG